MTSSAKSISLMAARRSPSAATTVGGYGTGDSCRRRRGKRRLSYWMERACRLEMNDHGRGEVVCTAIFGKAGAEVEGRCASLRIALLRAFLLHAFGDTVDDEFPHRSQMLLGERAELLGEQSAATVEYAPLPDGHIGDIGSTARQ